jgi:transcriptional regulator with XRE-family HTH domain
MYQYELIEIYMKTKGYSQAKQASSDLGISGAQITRIKTGERKIDEETAIYIAERCGLEVEEVLIKLSEEHAKTDKEKAVWANILKKYKARAMESIEGFAMSLKANLINFA